MTSAGETPTTVGASVFLGILFPASGFFFRCHRDGPTTTPTTTTTTRHDQRNSRHIDTSRPIRARNRASYSISCSSCTCRRRKCDGRLRKAGRRLRPRAQGRHSREMPFIHCLAQLAFGALPNPVFLWLFEKAPNISGTGNGADRRSPPNLPA